VSAEFFEKHDVLLSPVLAHTTPRLGHLSPNVPYEELIDRLTRYASFTPLANITGDPAISLPASHTAEGLPIAVMLSGPRGHEQTLLELAYEIEGERPWRRIQDTLEERPAACG
jgi:amidase